MRRVAFLALLAPTDTVVKYRAPAEPHVLLALSANLALGMAPLALVRLARTTRTREDRAWQPARRCPQGFTLFQTLPVTRNALEADAVLNENPWWVAQTCVRRDIFATTAPDASMLPLPSPEVKPCRSFPNLAVALLGFRLLGSPSAQT